MDNVPGCGTVLIGAGTVTRENEDRKVFSRLGPVDYANMQRELISLRVERAALHEEAANARAMIEGLKSNNAALNEQLIEAGTIIAKVEPTVRQLAEIKEAIRADDNWINDWCVICHEHPSHNHGGTDCPMFSPEDRLRAQVFESLQNSLENGHDPRTNTPDMVASDLTRYDADLEDRDPSELKPLVREWVREQNEAEKRAADRQ